MSKAEELSDKLEHQVNFGSYDWERVEPMMLDSAAELRRLSAMNAKLISATTRILRSFPTDTDMHYLGWDQCDVDEACNAYDAAHAEIENAKAT